VDEVEESGDDGDVLVGAVIVVGIEGDVTDDPELGEEIESEERDGDEPEEAVGADAFPAGAGAAAVGGRVDLRRRSLG
jgi:hypothetical protein